MRRINLVVTGALCALVAVVLLAAAWLHRRAPHRERTGTAVQAPSPVPQAAQQGSAALQLPADGSGPLFQRRYHADIVGARLAPEALMRRVRERIHTFSPAALAAFRKTKGRRQPMRVGHEYTIKILGPWNGKVRVIEVEPTAFAFVTLEGHPEAGEIRFSLEPHPQRPEVLRFEISSWARSRDALVSLSYNELKLGKQVQKSIWLLFCERVVQASGGQLLGEIEVLTDEQPFTGEVVPHG